MIYTDEQWEIIKKASPHYITVKREFIRNAPRWLTEQIIMTYENATGKIILNKDLSCAACILHIYQQIGKTYFSDLAEREELEKEKEENKDGREEEIPKKTNSRNSKKKKRDNSND